MFVGVKTAAAVQCLNLST